MCQDLGIKNELIRKYQDVIIFCSAYIASYSVFVQITRFNKKYHEFSIPLIGGLFVASIVLHLYKYLKNVYSEGELSDACFDDV